jgi:hypothetical protein
VLGWQRGPSVLVAHSFGGMVLTEAGVDPRVSAVVYVAARALDAGENYTALAKRFPTPPASAGIVWSNDWGRLTEEAFLRDAPPTSLPKGHVSSMRSRPLSSGRCSLGGRLMRRGARSLVGMPCPRRTGRSIPISSGLWPTAWARRPQKSRRAAFRLSRDSTRLPTLFWTPLSNRLDLGCRARPFEGSLGNIDIRADQILLDHGSPPTDERASEKKLHCSFHQPCTGREPKLMSHRVERITLGPDAD